MNALADLRGHVGGIFCLAYSPDGHLLASGGMDRTVRIWDAEKTECLRTWSSHRDRVLGISFSPDGKFVASGSADKWVKVWDVSALAEVRSLGPHKGLLFGGVNDVEFSPTDGDCLAVAGWKAVDVWRISTGERLQHLRHAVSWVRSCDSVCFICDGKLCISTSDSEIRIWDASDWSDGGPLGREENTFEGCQAVPKPRSATIAVRGGFGAVSLWDVAARKKIGTIETKEPINHSACFTADGSLLATCDSGEMTFWDVESLSKVHALDTGCICCAIAFHPYGQGFAVGRYDGTITIHEVPRG